MGGHIVEVMIIIVILTDGLEKHQGDQVVSAPNVGSQLHKVPVSNPAGGRSYLMTVGCFIITLPSSRYDLNYVERDLKHRMKQPTIGLTFFFQQSRGMTVQELERGFHGMSLDHGQVCLYSMLKA